MAYDRDKVYKQAIDVIEKHKLFFVEDLAAYLPINKKTIYEWWPIGGNKSNAIKEALEKNKIEIKVSMRNKWYKSDNATLQMGLMKLIATDDERKALSQSYHDHTTDGEKIQPQPQLNESQVDKIIDKL